MTENVEHYRNQIALARTEIKNLRQQLSSLKHEHLKEIKAIKEALSELRCANCAESATTVQRDVIEQPSSSVEVDGGIAYRAIGVIETSFQNKRGVPRQPSVLAKARGAVVIDPSIFNNPEHALSGLEEFSHMWIIFHFHATESSSVPAKVSPPRLGGERRGVFSTRSPHRPCPIGLSLVKIESIEGNRIYFFGVDMVNGTPVLDIKPYIPQYDYPVFETPMSSLVRPPTEGTSDGLDVANLQLDDSYDARSLSPRQTNPVGDTSPAALPPTAPSPDSPSSTELLAHSLRSPTRRPDTERGAPDGQERFTPPQSAQLLNLTHDGIRVAPWIDNPPTQTYDVRFTDDALTRLVELIGDRAQAFKNNLIGLLSEDPRSNYVRTRYPDHEYNCVLEDLSISCVFDVASAVCTIIAVRNADDLQN
ncbi:tRNA (adenine(37)-N6)-methyltransferase [Leguminivora glycinivorella]|uniref:tRNA (adenine(37)-N6)-methyltransferase n=1 Tax=Leguminivora glycinivorella TaxID=1035111 RepID=UPI00200EE6FB|nr:tRNA (adenine(37)-N6)-methyltransferase [Leguminivora glycinivorella]